MRNHPERIEQNLRTVAEMNLNIGRTREQLDKMEADLQLEIALAKGEDGKPLFSNDSLRKAAFNKAILENGEHAVISQSLEHLERDRLYLLALIERLRLEFKLYLLDRQAEITI